MYITIIMTLYFLSFNILFFNEDFYVKSQPNMSFIFLSTELDLPVTG